MYNFIGSVKLNHTLQLHYIVTVMQLRQIVQKQPNFANFAANKQFWMG